MNGRDAAASRCVQTRRARVCPTIEPGCRSRTPNAPARMKTMLKTLSAALIAASMLIAPIAANAAQPVAAPATTKTVKLDKKHKRHVKHHVRAKFAKHA